MNFDQFQGIFVAIDQKRIKKYQNFSFCILIIYAFLHQQQSFSLPDFVHLHAVRFPCLVERTMNTSYFFLELVIHWFPLSHHVLLKSLFFSDQFVASVTVIREFIDVVDYVYNILSLLQLLL